MKIDLFKVGLAAVMALGLPSLALAAAEADNQVCYKMKDTNQVDGEANALLAGFLNCTVRVKAVMLCVAKDRDGGDDPRGGALGTTICYKAKCADTGGTLASGTLDTQYGTHATTVDVDRPAMICLPVGGDL